MPTDWRTFEEIVGGSSCYGAGIGAVERSQGAAFDGQWSLLVEANRAHSTKSNHLIGHRNIGPRPSGIYRYEAYALVDPATANQGQTGPEFSSQFSRQVGSKVLTSTAGVQLLPNPFLPVPNTWQVWRETAPGSGVAGWESFLTQPLQAGQWYLLALEFDYDANRYRRFEVRGPGVDRTVDLAAFRIAHEDKGFGVAWELTLESENLFNNCGTAGSFTYRVYYDGVRVLAPAPCSPRPPLDKAVTQIGSGTLRAQLMAVTSSLVPANRLESVTFTRLANASIDVEGGPTDAPPNVPIPLSANQQPLVLTVRRRGPGPFTAQIVVRDACGDWPTLVGGGAGVS